VRGIAVTLQMRACQQFLVVEAEQDQRIRVGEDGGDFGGIGALAAQQVGFRSPARRLVSPR
jgi:hypothetical protein